MHLSTSPDTNIHALTTFSNAIISNENLIALTYVLSLLRIARNCYPLFWFHTYCAGSEFFFVLARNISFIHLAYIQSPNWKLEGGGSGKEGSSIKILELCKCDTWHLTYGMSFSSWQLNTSYWTSSVFYIHVAFASKTMVCMERKDTFMQKFKLLSHKMWILFITVRRNKRHYSLHWIGNRMTWKIKVNYWKKNFPVDWYCDLVCRSSNTTTYQNLYWIVFLHHTTWM